MDAPFNGLKFNLINETSSLPRRTAQCFTFLRLKTILIHFPILCRSPHVTSGAYHLAKKIQKFRFKVKWKGNFPENPFGNCGLPPEVVLFFRSKRNVGNFPGLLKDLRAVLVLISSGWSAYSENPLPLCNGHTNRIFLTNGQHPSCPSYANLIPIYTPFFPILIIPNP